MTRFDVSKAIVVYCRLDQNNVSTVEKFLLEGMHTVAVTNSLDRTIPVPMTKRIAFLGMPRSISLVRLCGNLMEEGFAVSAFVPTACPILIT